MLCTCRPALKVIPHIFKTVSNQSDMKLENQTVGHNIAKYRRLKDIKASEIASRLGMKEGTYGKYERNETEITIAFLEKVSEILEIDPKYLLLSSVLFSKTITHTLSTLSRDNDHQAND